MSNNKQSMGDMQFNGTPGEWEALVKKNKMSNNKQDHIGEANKMVSSVEQFAIALYEKGLLIGNGDLIQTILDLHKAMHKEEIIEAFDEGQEYEYQYRINSTPKFDSETYYNETFGE